MAKKIQRKKKGGLKDYFIPHSNNAHKPRFFQEQMVWTLLLVMVFSFSFSIIISNGIRQSRQTAAIYASKLITLTNQSREDYNLSDLAVNPVLQHVAELKAQDMSLHHYFAHTSPDGLTPWYWFDQAGYVFVYAGENLAIDFSQSDDIENAWMNSPEHRANILNEKFTEIGIATAEGEYEGHKTTYVVQVFGTPLTTYEGGPVPSSSKTDAPSSVQDTPDQTINTTLSNQNNGAGTTSQPFVEEDSTLKTEKKNTNVVTSKPPQQVLGQSEKTPTYSRDTKTSHTEPIAQSTQEPSTKKSSESPLVNSTSTPTSTETEVVTDKGNLIVVRNIAVTKVNSTTTPVISSLDSSSGGSSGTVPWYVNLFTNPSTLVSYVYIILGSLIFLSLIIMIAVEIRIQHPKQIAYALLLLVIVSSMFYMNSYLNIPQSSAQIGTASVVLSSG